MEVVIIPYDNSQVMDNHLNVQIDGLSSEAITVNRARETTFEEEKKIDMEFENSQIAADEAKIPHDANVEFQAITGQSNSSVSVP